MWVCSSGVVGTILHQRHCKNTHPENCKHLKDTQRDKGSDMCERKKKETQHTQNYQNPPNPITKTRATKKKLFFTTQNSTEHNLETKEQDNPQTQRPLS